MTDIWNAAIYSEFLEARTKVAKDLLFGISETFKPSIVYDLGCGPGNSTILLRERWPEATVIGIDSSEDMLQQAKNSYSDLHFIKDDLTYFNPEGEVDCIFANASLQWVSDHDTLIPKLLSFLTPGGVLAIQMPNNWHHPSHQTTINLLESHQQWQHLLSALRYGRLQKPFYDAARYYDILKKTDTEQVTIWQTDYIQVMKSHQAIFNWVRGTGLRPVLSKMSDLEKKKFEAAYVEAIEKAYPMQTDGKILLPYQRLFFIAIKK